MRNVFKKEHVPNLYFIHIYLKYYVFIINYVLLLLTYKFSTVHFILAYLRPYMLLK